MKEETKIALIQKDVEYIKKSQDRTELALAALQGTFWTTKGHEEFVKDVNNQLASVREDMKDVNKRIGLQKYILPIFSSLITSIILLLLISFLQHAH